METSEAANQLLKNKYDLHKTQGVTAAALGHERRTGDRIPQDPLARIENFLSLWHERLTSEDNPRRVRNLERVTQVLHNRYIIKPDEIPEGYFENQRRLAREQGHGDIEITPQARAQLTEVIIADQTSSMDKWIDYLASPDAPYPDALKYWTIRSVLNMSEYDKEKKMYPQRSRGTTKPFPDLNREALAYVIDAVDKKYLGQKHPDPEFSKLLQGENFAKLYAWAIEKVTPASEEELAATNGEWIKYNQNSDPTQLVQSLQGHGTGWCSAGESTARTHLQGGDFYVYYSLDKSGKPTVPRAAIRMEGSRIAEVRGIAAEQNLDSGAVTVLEEKLKEFPDGPSYQKKVADMRRLTNIENQTQEGISLSAEDLVFLYEIDAPIEGFGFNKDPRIEEIRRQRNPEVDMPIVFGCTREQIARSADQIGSETEAYVGPLEPGIFDRLELEGVEHIYTSFPEGRILIEETELKGRSKAQLIQDLTEAGIQFPYAKTMIESKAFEISDPETIKTVKLRVADLGLKNVGTTAEIIGREDDVDEHGNPAPFTKGKMSELGLELCPYDLAVYKRLEDKNQPVGDYYSVMIEPIAVTHGILYVFGVDRLEDELWLDAYWAGPGRGWNPGSEIVFRFRKSEPQTLKPSGIFSRILRR